MIKQISCEEAKKICESVYANLNQLETNKDLALIFSIIHSTTYSGELWRLYGALIDISYLADSTLKEVKAINGEYNISDESFDTIAYKWGLSREIIDNLAKNTIKLQ